MEMGRSRGPQVADWWQAVPVGGSHCRQRDDTGGRLKAQHVGGNGNINTERQEGFTVGVELGLLHLFFQVVARALLVCDVAHG